MGPQRHFYFLRCMLQDDQRGQSQHLLTHTLPSYNAFHLCSEILQDKNVPEILPLEMSQQKLLSFGHRN